MSYPQDPFDIVIIGAGPGGAAAALALRHGGLRCLLIDKATFPRDKVCGDAIPGRAIKELGRLDPAFAEGFADYPRAMRTARTAVYINGRPPFEFSWVNTAYTCKRLDFDARLLDLVRRHTDTEIREGAAVTHLEAVAGGVRIQLDNQDAPLTARLVIGADGAHSVVGKWLTDNRIDRAHYGAAVRTYYRGVSGVQAERAEIHCLPEFLPGYFWIFPLPGGEVNVGYGAHSAGIAKQRGSLKQVVTDFIAASPSLSERFAGSERIGPLIGFGLPFGSRRVRVAGDRFMLIGDAAALVDPASGDGIGNAMLSGRLAAEQAIACARRGDFSASATAPYARALYASLWPELRQHALGERIARHLPFLLDWGAAAMQTRPVRRFFHHNW